MKRLIIIACITLITTQIFAQASFTATVSKSSVTLNERFQLSFTFANGGNAQNFTAPALYDFYIRGGPSQSSSFQSINGRTSQSVNFLYVLEAKAVGTYTIAAAKISAGGQVYTTQPITITVSDKPAGGSTQSTPGQTADATQDLNDFLKDKFFIKTEVTDEEIYKGESITVTQKLYIKRNTQILGYALNLAATQLPRFDGFYAQNIDLPQQQPTIENMGGAQYYVRILTKTFCTAQQTGELKIDPMFIGAVLKIKDQKKSNSTGDPFDDFFNNFQDPFSSYQEVQCTISSPAIKIKVDDLPPNPPSDFNGAVGKFSMSTELNATQTKTDEPLTYRVVINGDGNLNLFQAPQLNLPPGWETYDPKITDGKNSRTYEYLLIPRSPGKFNIPAHTWSYFDPARKQYITLSSDSYDVNVEAGANYSGTSGEQGINKEDVELLAKDIRFIKKEDPHYEKNHTSLMGSLVFYGGMGLPLLLGLGIFVSSAKKRELEGDVVALKNRRATAIARKRLSRAGEFSKKNEKQQFYNETIRAIWGYLSDKFNIPQSELSKENIQTHLSNYQVSSETAQKVLALLNECELALFAPQLAGGSLDATYKNAIDLIATLEGEIKK